MSDERDAKPTVLAVDATSAEVEEMLGRTRARGLAALVAAGYTEDAGRS